MITLEQLNKINEQYPNEKAYQILAGPNLTFPQFISGNRVNMVTTHLEHTIPLDNPESCNMSTGFEKSFGEYTDSYKKAEADFMVIAVITKNEIMGRFKYVYVVQNIKTKVYDIIEVSHYECLSESQGYLRPYTEADKYVVGEVIKKGTVLYKSNNHDEFENYRFGNNANCCYISLQEDEEDACIISESYAKKTTWHTFEKIPCTLQKNQMLLNIYGDEYSYRCFPDIGEKIRDGMLYAKRTINYANAAAELTDSALRSIVSDDEVCAAHGYVADIDIWVNDREEFIDSENKAQIYKYYTLQLEFYTKVHDILGSIVNAKKGEHVQYTHKLRALYEQARNYLDINIQWLNNNNAFEFAYIVITTYEEKRLDVGYKITDRHGGKCIISAVLPDWMMPRDIYGVIADIIFSPPGTTARANPGQLYETEYNFCSEVIRQRIHALPTTNEKLGLLIDYVTTVNNKEGTALHQYIRGLSEAGVQDFLRDVDKNGIYLVQPPFMNTIAIDNLAGVYHKFKIAPDLITVKQEFRNTVTGILLENTKVPLRKANISLDKNIERNIEYLDNTKIRDIQGKPIGMVSPFDFKEGENSITPDYFIGPDFHGNKESYFITSKNGFMKSQENVSTTLRTTTQAASFAPVKAFKNAEGFLVREYQSQRPVVTGKKYILVLKQNPDDKFSVRSLGSTNQVGIPNKPGKQTNLMSPYSKSSIRNGEMENDNFFIRIDHEYVHRYMATHSTNPEMIEAMAVMLATEDPLTFHDLPIRNEDIKNDAPALMFHATLFSIGVQIKPIYKEKTNAKVHAGK
jgi:hypothetical protein